MKKSKFTEEQIAFALKQAEGGTTVEEVCRKMGISQATFYAWRKKFGGLGVAELRRLRQLEEENRKLKQLVADLSLDKVMLQDVLLKKALRPAQRKTLVGHLIDRWKMNLTPFSGGRGDPRRPGAVRRHRSGRSLDQHPHLRRPHLDRRLLRGRVAGGVLPLRPRRPRQRRTHPPVLRPPGAGRQAAGADVAAGADLARRQDPRQLPHPARARRRRC